MLLKKIVLTVSLLSIELFAFKCDSFDKSFIEVGNSRGSMDGYISSGSRLDIKSDLNLKKTANNLSAKIQKGFKKHKFGFKISKYKYSGKKKLNKDIIFNSEKLAKSQMISNKLDIKWAKATYRYKIEDSISAGIDFNLLQTKTYINQNKYKKNIVIPSISIDYSHDLADDIMLKAKISLTPYGKNRAMDSYAGIAIKLPSKRCSCLNIGYQVSNLHIQSSKFKSNLNYNGFYAGMKIGF